MHETKKFYYDMCFNLFEYLASVENVFVISKCGCGVGSVKVIENSLAKAVTQLFANTKSFKGLNPSFKQVGINIL